MQRCASCGEEIDENEMFMSVDGQVCGDCHIESETDSPFLGLGTLAWAGLIVGLVPFCLNITSTSTTNGQITEYTNYPALAGGPVAILVSLALGYQATQASDGALQKGGVAALVLVLGVVHILRGIGMFV